MKRIVYSISVIAFIGLIITNLNIVNTEFIGKGNKVDVKLAEIEALASFEWEEIEKPFPIPYEDDCDYKVYEEHEVWDEYCQCNEIIRIPVWKSGTLTRCEWEWLLEANLPDNYNGCSEIACPESEN